MGEAGTILHYDGSGWAAQPSGTSCGLNGVWAASSDGAWAVGEAGTILHYDGSGWAAQPSGVGGRDLKGISGTAANDVWACGANGALTHFGGAAWTADPQGFTNHLNALYSLAADAVWQVGDAFTGRAYISFGRASPPTRPEPDVTINGVDTFDYAGRPLASGDYDGDGRADLLIGAGNADGPGNAREDAGEAYLLRGRTDWPAVIDLSTGADTIIYGADAFDQFPEAAQSPLPYFNGDGCADLLLGTRFADGPGNLRSNCGEVYVIYGGSLPAAIDLAISPADITFCGGEADQEYGYDFCAFDFNRDTLTDVFISSIKLGKPGGRSVNGVVSMVNGRASWPALVDLGVMTDLYVYGAENEDLAGLSLSGANIHNADPGDFRDLVVSSRASGPGGIRPGCGEHCIFLGYDNVPPTCEIAGLEDGQVLTGLVGVDVEAYDYFGVTRVDFYLDGSLRHTDTSAPYHWDLETLGLEDGRDHVVEAVARDPHGNTGMDARAVSILNALPSPSEEWYLAEGSTAWGFEEWVLVQNPNPVSAEVRVTFMREDGTTVETDPPLALPPTSRLSLNVADYVGEADVSTRVLADAPVVCERAMYWNGRAEGHDSIGTTTLSRSWYLAEGSTAWGFEEWVLVQNPNPVSAEVRVTFMREDGTTVETDPPLALPPTSRRSINVADYVGEADVSTLVEADQPVIVERAMYRYDREVGHDTAGTPALSRTWYLAEGTTAWGFDEWVLLQNPGTAPATVAVEFMKADGTIVPYGVVLAPRSRRSIHVNEVPGCAAADLSARISSDRPIICERAMYWNGAGKQAGHVTLGTPMALPRWYLAEGTTAWGFETFILVQNPNGEPCAVTLTFMLADGSFSSPVYTVPANARFTVKVNDLVAGSDVSTLVTGSLPIIAERAMYWNSRGGGHCTVGAWGR